MTTDEIIDEILRREGGFVDDENDRGGATNHGITQAVLSEWRGCRVSRHDVRDLPRDEAAMIYRTLYIKKPGFHHIDDTKLRALVIDCGVNHGPSRAAKWLQASVGARQDGKVGPNTIAAVNAADAGFARMSVLGQRFKFYAQIATDQGPGDPDAKFLRGWINRACEFLS